VFYIRSRKGRYHADLAAANGSLSIACLEKEYLSMERYLRGIQLLILALAITIPARQFWAHAKPGQANPPPKAAEQKKDEPEYSEEEYIVMEAARDEKDPAKKAALCTAFLEKFPKSTLKVYVVNAYENLLFETSKAGDNQNLMQFAEQWLKLNPNDLRSRAYIIEAAAALGQHQKSAEYGEKLFAEQPNVKVALPIYKAYEKLGNKAKTEEWTLKLLEFPEYANDLQILMQLVARYVEKEDLPKSATYAGRALKAVPGAAKPDSTSDADWAKALTSVKKTCHDIVGKNYFNQKKYAEAIQAMTEANEVVGKNILSDKYDDGFYYIGMSQWQQGNVEIAWQSLETAAQIKGKLESKAHKNAIDLYKSQRNGTEVGYDKVVKKALAALEAMAK
jgi:hypothetical protein